MPPVHNFDAIIERRGGDSVKWNTCPDGVLPMWVADADFLCPEPVLTALEERVRHGVFGYSSQPGMLEEAVAHWMDSRFGWAVEREWVAFAPSVVASMVLCVTAFTSPGDAVVFLTPTYPPFFSVPPNHGRVALGSPMQLHDGRYEIDFDNLEQQLEREETTLFFLCNPQNPTGRVFSQEELSRIGHLCLKHNVLVFSDEIHCDFVHPGRKHFPFSSLSQEFAAHSLVAVNPSKTFTLADLHASAIICPNPGLRERFVKSAEIQSLHPSALGILSLHTAYMECDWYADQATAYVKENIDMAVAFINDRVKGIRAYVPEATFLLWLDCSGLGLEQEELELFMTDKARLMLSTGTAFGEEGRGHMRMNLACPRATVVEALARLERAVEGRMSV